MFPFNFYSSQGSKNRARSHKIETSKGIKNNSPLGRVSSLAPKRADCMWVWPPPPHGSVRNFYDLYLYYSCDSHTSRKCIYVQFTFYFLRFGNKNTKILRPPRPYTRCLSTVMVSPLKKNMPSHTKQRISYHCKGDISKNKCTCSFQDLKYDFIGSRKGWNAWNAGVWKRRELLLCWREWKKWGLRATSDSLGRVIAGTLTPRATELNKKPQTKWHRVWSAAVPNIKSLNARRHALVGVKNISNSSGAAHAHHDFDIKRAFFDSELKIFRGQCFMVMNHTPQQVKGGWSPRHLCVFLP